MTSVKDLSHFYAQCVFKPIYKRYFTQDNRNPVIKLLIHMNEKRDRTLKGRSYADKKPQCKTQKAELTSSSMASLKEIRLIFSTDTHKKKEGAMIKIPNVFVQTDFYLENDYGKF